MPEIIDFDRRMACKMIIEFLKTTEELLLETSLEL